MNSDNLILVNAFGTISDKKVYIINKNYKIEEIEIADMASVDFQKKRNYFLAFAGIALGIAVIIGYFVEGFYMQFEWVPVLFLLFFAICGILLGVTHFLGSHYIKIHKKNGVTRKVYVELSKINEGRHFSEVLDETIKKANL